MNAADYNKTLTQIRDLRQTLLDLETHLLADQQDTLLEDSKQRPVRTSDVLGYKVEVLMVYNWIDSGNRGLWGTFFSNRKNAIAAMNSLKSDSLEYRVVPTWEQPANPWIVEEAESVVVCKHVWKPSVRPGLSGSLFRDEQSAQRAIEKLKLEHITYRATPGKESK